MGMKTEFLYGIHPVHEALRAGRRSVYRIFMARGRQKKAAQPLLGLARERGIEVESPEPSFWSGAPRPHQGIAARVSPYPLEKHDALMQKVRGLGDHALVLMLDNIVDPQNFGALARTALCAGVHGVFFPEDRCAGPTPAVSRASAGAVEHLAVAAVANTARALGFLKEAGFWVFGLDPRASRTVYEADFRCPLALVVGGEDKGLRPVIKGLCDALVSIPGQGPVGSLNASVAGALVLYEVQRQRGWPGCGT